MSSFINRQDDLAKLGEEYERPGASLVVLYGRRRVGKTSLIAEFGRDKNMLYFLATAESEIENRRQFKDLVAEFTGNALLASADVGWDAIFDSLLRHEPDRRKLIVLDEFQYIGKSNPAFPSVFQKIWDTKLKDQNVMVVLCGSLISLMEAQTLSYDSPLYGRRTAQIKLGAIPFAHYHEFYSDKDARELAQYYSVTGGVPKYIELFSEEKDVFTAIEKHVFSTRSFLYEEPVFLLQGEVSEIGSYFSLIRAIAAGNRKLGAIASVMGVKETGLTRYLRTLIDLGILEREVPVTEQNPEKSKRGLYRIKDHFIDFWFKFVYPERSFLETGHTERAMERLRETFVSGHVSYVYEDVCRQKMWLLAASGQLPMRFDKVGRWWDGKTEIDIVALDSAGDDAVFCECKYRKESTDVDVYFTLLDKIKAVPWKKESRHEHVALFSVSGFSPQMRALAKNRENVYLFD